MADQLKGEIEVLDDALRASEADIAKLQNQAARGPRPPECDR